MTALVREDVQSYPRPPAHEPVPQRIIVRHGGVLVADTGAALRCHHEQCLRGSPHLPALVPRTLPSARSP